MADVVYDYITDKGVIVPDAQDIIEQVEAEYKDAFGSDIVLTANTPQGILAAAEELARLSVATNNAKLANQINPNLAGGIFLDAILALTGSKRNPDVYSTVTGNLTGVPGTIVPIGSQAQETVNNEIFETLSQATLDISGNATVTFRAVNPGPITVAVETLTQIVSQVLGWETVNNTSVATLGQLTQSDASARQLRAVTLAAQGMSISEAITSALYLVEGVESLQFRENVANTTQVIDGITMVAKSIYACVYGGADDDIANALVAKKSAGAAYNGGTTVVVVDPFSGQSMDVKFDRPDEILVLVRVTIQQGNSTQNLQTAVKQAIVDYANGNLDDISGLGVGVPVSCFELGGAIVRQIPGAFVQNVETSLVSPLNFSNAEIPIAIDEIAIIIEENITVIVV